MPTFQSLAAKPSSSPHVCRRSEERRAANCSDQMFEREAERASAAALGGGFAPVVSRTSRVTVQRQEAGEKPRDQPTKFPVEDPVKTGKEKEDAEKEKVVQAGLKAAGELAKVLWDAFSKSAEGQRVLSANARDWKPVLTFFEDFAKTAIGKIVLGAAAGGTAAGMAAGAWGSRDAPSVDPDVSPSTGGSVRRAPKDEKFFRLELNWDFVTPPTGFTLKTPWVDAPKIGPSASGGSAATPTLAPPPMLTFSPLVPRICTPADPQGDRGEADARSAFIYAWLKHQEEEKQKYARELVQKYGGEVLGPPKYAPSVLKPMFKREAGADPVSDDVAVAAGLRSPGQPLDPATRTFMESRFGQDFSAVRIHTNETAAASARALSARAYTVGQDVAFGANEFAPSTPRGRELIAHELAHTIQQRPNVGGAPSNHPRGIHEVSANAAARDVVNGRAVAGNLPGCGVGPSLQPDDGDLFTDPSYFTPGGYPIDDVLKQIDQEKENEAKKELAATQQEDEARHDRLMVLRSIMERRGSSGHYFRKNEILAQIQSHPRDLLVLRYFGLELPSRWTKQIAFHKHVVKVLNAYDAHWEKTYGSRGAPAAREWTPEKELKSEKRREEAENEAAASEGYRQSTQTILAGAGAGITRQFTDDPKKIAAGAGLGTATSGAVGARLQAAAQKGSYSPRVENPRFSPVGSWRYSGVAPTVPANPAASQMSRIPPVARPTDITNRSAYPAVDEQLVSMRLPETKPASAKRGGGRRIHVPAPKPAPKIKAPEKTPPEKETRKRPESGAEMEKRLLDADRPARAPSTEYFGWEGGSRGTFGSFADALRRHARTVGAIIPRLNRAVMKLSTRAFIAQRPALQAQWDAEVTALTDQIGRVQTAMRNARGDKVTIASLRSQEQTLQEQLSKLNDWANQPVQSKRPDLIEVFPAEQRAQVTDITQRPYDPSHNFKTQFYVEVVRAILGWTNVAGVEFRTPRSQRVID